MVTAKQMMKAKELFGGLGLALVLTGCDLGDYLAAGSFYNSGSLAETEESAASGSTASTSSIDCIGPVLSGSGDPCFSQDSGKTGLYDFNLRPTSFPLHTHVDPSDLTLPYLSGVVTASDEEGALYVLRSVRNKVSGSPSGNPGFEFSKIPLKSAGNPVWQKDFPNTTSGDVASAILVDTPQGGIRHIYVAYTSGGVGSTRSVFLCRYRENLSDLYYPIALDTTWAGSTGCAKIYSDDGFEPGFATAAERLDTLYSGSILYSAQTHRVHLAFHHGSDGTRRVVLAATVSQSGSDKVLIAPFRISDGTLSRPGPITGMNAVHHFAINTNNQGNTFALSGGSNRPLKVFALETDRDESAPSTAFLGVQFENPVLSAANGGGNRVEHLIYKLKNDLTVDLDFGGNGKEAIYIPADQGGLPGTVIRLNTRPESDARSVPALKISNGRLYVAGLHADSGPVGNMGYKILRFSTSATSYSPDASSVTFAATLCSRKATPALATQANSAGLLFACSQDHSSAPSTPDNALVRAHDGLTLANSQRYSQSCGNGGLCIEGAFDNLPGAATGTFSPGIQLVRDDARGQWLLRFVSLYPNGLGDFYPQVLQLGY